MSRTPRWLSFERTNNTKERHCRCPPSGSIHSPPVRFPTPVHLCGGWVEPECLLPSSPGPTDCRSVQHAADAACTRLLIISNVLQPFHRRKSRGLVDNGGFASSCQNMIQWNFYADTNSLNNFKTVSYLELFPFFYFGIRLPSVTVFESECKTKGYKLANPTFKSLSNFSSQHDFSFLFSVWLKRKSVAMLRCLWACRKINNKKISPHSWLPPYLWTHSNQNWNFITFTFITQHKKVWDFISRWCIFKWPHCINPI